MPTRKPISKRVRFEIFKRDRFSCRYCGAKAPDVLLHVDHIHPVKEGGTNDVENLVSACKDCNQGKGAVLLSLNQTITMSRDQLATTADEVEQLEMMAQWRRELMAVKKSESSEFIEFASETIWMDADTEKELKSAISKHGIDKAYEHFDEFVTNRESRKEYGHRLLTYSQYISAIEKKDTYEGRIKYLTGIVRNRTSANVLREFYEWLSDIEENKTFVDNMINSLRAYMPVTNYLNKDMFIDWWHPYVSVMNGHAGCCDYHGDKFAIPEEYRS